MAPSPTIRRLLKETQELSPAAKHPNPAFHAAPVSEHNLHEWHFTLCGPPSPSPYAGGIYHGRITLPSAYPMKPPNFRFLTPSGRFEVNREICLSISGFHEETWQPAWGVRLALTALRGFMGEEGTAGQVGGLESPKHVRQKLAQESKSWRCQGCGGTEEGDNIRGWTNQERMEWWWGICREKDVNVEAEIAGIEGLPDGMKVEARDVKVDKGKQKETAPQEEEVARPDSTTDSADQPVTPLAAMSHVSTATLQNDQLTAPVTTAATPVHARNNPQTTPPAQVQYPQQQRPQDDSPITLDRAITVVLLALCLAIVKRLFYPSTSGAIFGGYDDLRLMRE